MKKIIPFILLIAVSWHVPAQDITGKWYMINQSGLFEFHITKDSVIVRNLFSDLSPKGQKQARAYRSARAAGGKTVLVTKDGNDTTKLLSTVFFDVKKNKTLQMAWNIKDTLTKDTATLFEIHKANKAKLFGYTLYHEKYLPHLKQMKSVDQMTLEEFKKLLKVCTEKIQETSQAFDEYNIGYSERDHYFQLNTQALFDCGFNPVETPETIEFVFEKYHNDPEVKEIMSRRMQKK